MRHFISLLDISLDELQSIVNISEQVKALLSKGVRPAWLPRQVIALLFEKPSLRTRVSFEAGMSQLGGNAMFLGQEVGWQNREATSDFVQVLAQYADYVVCRAKSHASVTELASFNCVPIINGLTDECHPCQALADLLTMREKSGTVTGKTVTFVGDGNNVARSLATICAMVGMRFRLLGPREYFFADDVIESIAAEFPSAIIEQSEDTKSINGSEFVYTDVWTSMGQEAEMAERRSAFKSFQLNSDLLRHAANDCQVLHCLPARRGEEITDDVIDGKNSAVVAQAGNRMHSQKALLLWLALQQGTLKPVQLEKEGVEIAPSKDFLW